jgi:hypothetical protein
MTDKVIIDRVRSIRSNNNGLWMRLLEIALESEPVKTKVVLKQINANDKAISDLVGKLAK